jgi:hypothetical protein
MSLAEAAAWTWHAGADEDAARAARAAAKRRVNAQPLHGLGGVHLHACSVSCIQASGLHSGTGVVAQMSTVGLAQHRDQCQDPAQCQDLQLAGSPIRTGVIKVPAASLFPPGGGRDGGRPWNEPRAALR